MISRSPDDAASGSVDASVYTGVDSNEAIVLKVMFLGITSTRIVRC